MATCSPQIVVIGMGIAARPADANHPYGHGRFETLSAFVVGVILAAGGVMISYQSLQAVGVRHEPPAEHGQRWRWLERLCCAASCRP